MTRYYSIASGSKGNCGLLITEKLNILIDMGVSFKYLKESLSKHNFTLDDIDLVLITHEHIDHVSGLPMLTKNTQIPIFMTNRSYNFAKHKDNIKNTNFFAPNETLNFGDVTVETFKTPHDSAESVGFKIYDEKFSFAYVTDLGFMPNSILNTISTCDMVVLESNYDEYMLDNGFYPQSVKRRIASNEGHLSNVESSNCVLNLISKGVNQIILAHLSENNNTPKNVYDQISNMIKFHDLDVKIAENIHIAPVKNDYPIINLKKVIESREIKC